MNEESVNFFNQMGAGTFICIVIAMVSFVGWVYEKYKTLKNQQKSKIEEDLKDDLELSKLIKSMSELVPTVEKLTENMAKMQKEFNKHIQEEEKNVEYLSSKVDDSAKRLDATDKLIVTDIRSFILSEYQKWMILGYIDVYSMSVIEDKYEIYRILHGNHFVASLVEQLRLLPTKYVITNSSGQDPVNYFSTHPNEHPSIRANLSLTDPQLHDNDTAK